MSLDHVADRVRPFHLRVFGVPVPQGRPRAFVARSGHASVYERRQDKDWKAVVKAQVIAAVMDRRELPWPGALTLDLTFYLPRPVSLPKRIVLPMRRPDCDNLAKAIKDCLKGLVYRDDAQVVDLGVHKRYDARPGVYLVAEPCQEAQP